MPKPKEAESRKFVSVTHPEDWQIDPGFPWTRITPPRSHGPTVKQGWKIHISATPSNVRDVIQRAHEVCFANSASFKSIVGWDGYFALCGKYAPRSASGKLVTIYPEDSGKFERLLNELSEQLQGEHGPHVLTDLQYGRGPVYFRYGAFRSVPFEADDGRIRLGITAPNGVVEPDDRSPTFKLPSWALVPECVSDLVEGRCAIREKARESIAIGSYVVKRALHYSNGGGVYLALPSGVKNEEQMVVIKEARPWSAFDEGLHSAQDRFAREIAALNRYRDRPWCASMHEHFGLHGFEYMVLERIEGSPLRQWIVDHHPLTVGESKLNYSARYVEDALAIYEVLADAIREMHHDGYAFGDLSVSNVLINPIKGPVLIDFESCVPLSERDDSAPYTPGYSPAHRVRPVERDAFSLVAILAMLLSPKSLGNFDLDRTFIKASARDVRQMFGTRVAREFERLAGEQIGTTSLHSNKFGLSPISCSLDLSDVAARIGRGLEQNPFRSDFVDRNASANIFYGCDPQPTAVAQHAAAFNIENGIAGVMMAKARCSMRVDADIDFLERHCSAVRAMPFHGLLEGRIGLAAAVAECTRDATIMERLCGEDLRDQLTLNLPVDDSVRAGLAGTLIAALWVNDSLPNYFTVGSLAAALRQRVEQTGVNLRPGNSEVQSTVGLFDGPTGVGLAMKIAAFYHEESRAENCELARQMGTLDLKQLRPELKDGEDVLKVRHGKTEYPYLSEGATGLAVGLSLIDKVHFDGEIKALAHGVNPRFPFNLGLFRGLIGIHAGLAMLGQDMVDLEACRAIALRHLRHSALMHDPSQICVTIGDAGFRLSEDYATGSSGILLGIRALLGDTASWLPLPIRFMVEGR